MEKQDQIAQIKVSLEGPRPPIWRRILVPLSMTLGDLHSILLTVMGWDGYHLHNFLINGTYYHDDWDDDLEWSMEDQVKLGDVISRSGQQFHYEYDFGDSWRHTLLVEAILQPQAEQMYPVCIKGKHACPPEDVGGVWGYEEFVEAMADKNHPRHDEFLSWYGSKFDPEEFDLEQVNQELRNPSHAKIKDQGVENDAYSMFSFNTIFHVGAEVELPGITPEVLETVKELPRLKDIHVLLDFLGSNKVVGTSAKGNFPLKACAALSSLLSKPFAMEYQLGNKPMKVRSEDELLDLNFTHMLAIHSRLIEGGKNKQWKLTPAVELFRSLNPIRQMTILFFAWFLYSNWMIFDEEISASDMYGIDIKLTILEMISSMQAGELVDLSDFAHNLLDMDEEDDEDFEYEEDFENDEDDEDYEDFDDDDFIDDEELDAILETMPEEISTWVTNPMLIPILQIAKSVMEPMEAFGIIRIHHQKLEFGKDSLALPEKVEMTPLGRNLLDTVNTTLQEVEAFLAAAKKTEAE